MGRIAVWLFVIALAAGGVYVAANGRYEYFNEGSSRMRKDRWTGAVQTYECVARYVRGSESASFPMATPTPEAERQCARFGWNTRK